MSNRVPIKGPDFRHNSEGGSDYFKSGEGLNIYNQVVGGYTQTTEVYGKLVRRVIRGYAKTTNRIQPRE